MNAMGYKLPSECRTPQEMPGPIHVPEPPHQPTHWKVYWDFASPRPEELITICVLWDNRKYTLLESHRKAAATLKGVLADAQQLEQAILDEDATSVAGDGAGASGRLISA